MSRDTLIPTNLLVGLRGSGKSFCINQLMEFRPSKERWGVFLNDRGITAVDGVPFNDSIAKPGVWVEELSNGCACCTLGLAFEPLLAKFIQRLKPDRLLIELNCAAHPAPILKKLRQGNLASNLLIGSTICIVNPDLWTDSSLLKSATFREQLRWADLEVWNSESCGNLDDVTNDELSLKRKHRSIHQLKMSDLA